VRLREALARTGNTGAILLGPWLGTRGARAQALASAVGVPVGEALAGAGSPAGLRFEAGRDALLETIGVDRIRGRALAIEVVEGRLRVNVERREGPLAADAVVLAIGGMAGGGVVYTPPEHIAGEDLPSGARMPFALSLAAPVGLGDGRDPLEVVSSLHGPELDEVAWPSGERPGLLEAIGVQCEGLRAGAGIFAAGDVVAGRRRTALEAVTMGIRAGNEASL
jgi:glycerol-3-phosphate dehydrogenase subunit B